MSKRTNDRDRRPGYWRERAVPQPVGRLALPDHTRLVKAYVEGYEDVAFWRGIFDHYESEELRFEVSVPPRRDLAKGKKVLFEMEPNSSPYILLCADSDFDYLFGDSTPTSKRLNSSPYMFHTYAYATENYICYAPTLHNICVKATKNDTRIFDFERFMASYSDAIYPLFLWYAFSAELKSESHFTLLDFKSSVKLNYVDISDGGDATITWLRRQVGRRLETLHKHYPNLESEVMAFGRRIEKKGVARDNAYLFMQGHTLMDNVIMVVVHAVCDQLMLMIGNRIASSTKQGIALRNEQSNYNNSLRNVREILLDNENYKDCFLYQKLKKDMDDYVAELLKK